MKNIRKSRLKGLGIIVLITVLALSACTQSNAQVERSDLDFENDDVNTSASENSAGAEEVEQNESQNEDQGEPDMAAIQLAWEAGPHAASFVLDSAGENNACARCHAPVNWMPTMDDIPETCLTCKFELKDPPPLIPEEDWIDIPCYTCHPVDKKDNIQPEIAWLEIAAIGEYAEVSSATELCQKCHPAESFPGHNGLALSGAHQELTCVECHDPHDAIASCADENCHPNVLGPETAIPGHDESHALVICSACHDGSGMEIGIDQETGQWETMTLMVIGDEEALTAFTSHAIVLESPCEKCHFPENPWQVLEEVTQP